MSTILEAALRYAAAGIPVFPCSQEDKSPLVNGGFYSATTDADQIKAWWQQYPRAMIGMPTGMASGIDVLDIDCKKSKNGFAALPGWQDRSSVIVSTPSGGAHLWFKSDGNIHNTADYIANGVDTRGLGGYAIVPPSVNGSAAYRFEKGSIADVTALPPFPADLRALLPDDCPRAPNEEQQADPGLVAAAAAVIPNDDVGWEDWNRIGMAIWAATGGDEGGAEAFHAWSAKSDKYNAKITTKKWKQLFRSPPNQIGAGTLFYLANEAAPGWDNAYHAAVEAELAAVNSAWLRGEHDDLDFGAEPASEPSSPAPEAPVVEAPTKPVADAPVAKAPAPQPKRSVTATPYNWIEPEQIPKRRWLYKPHYIRKFVSILFSTGGIGKSSLLIAEALAQASGKPLLNIMAERPLRVWYWNGEDPMDELQRRFAAAAKHYNLKPEDIADRLFVDSGRTAEIKIAVQAQRRNDFRIVEPIVKGLVEELLEKQFDVLMIDPFVSCHEVNENDNAAIQAVAKSWAYIADKTNCSIMLAHHTRKTKDEKTVDDGRGASALLNAARSGRVLNTMTQAEADGAQLEQRWLYFRSDIGKANLTKPAEHADWYKLVSVDLENPWDDGDEVGVVTPWQYPATKVQQLTAYDIARVQQAIGAGGPWRRDQRSTTEVWVGVPVAQALLLDPAQKTDRKAVADLIGQWIGLGYLKVVVKQDGNRKPKDYVVVGSPPAPVQQPAQGGDDQEPL